MKKFILCIIIFGRSAMAAWTPNTEAGVIIDRVDMTMDVKADGTHVEEEERQYTAKNESGRNKLALESLTFLPEMSKIEVLKAVSITDGVETAVDLKTIHERSAAGPKEGITGVKELVIPFTNLKIGSSIKYRIRTTTLKPLYPGVFAMQFMYGAQGPEMAGVVKLRSEKKLEYAVRDKDKALKIEEGKEKELYTLTITQVKPANKTLKDERLPMLSHDSFPQVQVTTVKNWQEFSGLIADKYEARLQEELPPVFKAIVDKAALKKDVYEKIDTVTSELATIMTYSGNWTTLEKMFFPRGHKEVAGSKTGDCKDFATSTAAMLRKLGISANVALVGRKSPYDPGQVIQTTALKEELAMPSLFNHAIVRVELPAKKVLWVDPTNAVSNSRFSNSDIAGSAALNVAKSTIAIEKVPYSGVEDSVVKVDKKLKLSADEKGESEGSISMTGFFAVSVMDTAFREGAKKANQNVGDIFGIALEDVGESIKADYKSRIAQNFEAKVKTFGEKVFAEKENKEYLYFPLPPYLSIYFAGYAPGRVTDFYAFVKSRYEGRTVVEGFDFVDTESFGCYAVSPWVDVERRLVKNEKGFEVIDRVTFKKDMIPVAELTDEEYGSSMSDIESCVGAQTVQVQKLTPGLTLQKRLSRFTMTEIKRLDGISGPGSVRRSMEVKMIAEHMLQKNPKDMDVLIEKIRAERFIGYRQGAIIGPVFVEYADRSIDDILSKDPNQPRALIQKSYNMIYGQKMDQAKTYFTKAYYASKEKTFELYRLGGYLSSTIANYSVAEGSYSKALALAKTDAEKAHAYRSLGGVYLDQKNHTKAETYLYSALKYSPDDAWLMNDIVVLALNKSDYDGAIEVGEKMLKVASFGVGRINVASAYGRKAAKILSSNSQDVTRFEKAADLAMKGMKWDEKSVDCMLALGQSLHETAALKKDVGLMKRSMDVSIKAVAHAKGPYQIQKATEVLNKASAAHSQMMRDSMRKPAGE
ncbi:DUF3857 domain-containing protein [Bdellovibrio sp. HCB337]|uniref:DUF3857 domain-containing protein n=1 Tax=Bdellovibrio sp. HCB337 TaxID=3394358 RepID=UPI0039A579FF